MAQKRRLYLDTSVIGGFFDKEFMEKSNNLKQAVISGKYIVLISPLVFEELEGAPEFVKKFVYSIKSVELVEIDKNILILRDSYLTSKVVSKNSIQDATHVALATFARADAIVSWNFKHIVKLEKIKGFNEVNFRFGFGSIVIITPEGVSYED